MVNKRYEKLVTTDMRITVKIEYVDLIATLQLIQKSIAEMVQKKRAMVKNVIKDLVRMELIEVVVMRIVRML
jgi:DNA-binding MarR family transcriptional regulator